MHTAAATTACKHVGATRTKNLLNRAAPYQDLDRSAFISVSTYVIKCGNGTVVNTVCDPIHSHQGS